jgi:hypothetical protein
MTRFSTIAVAALMLALSGLQAESAAQCASGSEARQLIEQGQAMPLPSALQAAGLGDAQVLDAQLCRAGGGWSYRVRFRQGGQVSSANIPAG